MINHENYEIIISKVTQNKWKKSLDLMVKYHGSFDAIITRYNKHSIEIFKVSSSNNSCFEEGLAFEISQLLCEKTIKTDATIRFENLAGKSNLKKYKEVQWGYAAYLGMPLKCPNGEIFGTLALHYKKPHKFTKEMLEAMDIFKSLIESDIEMETNVINYELRNKKCETLLEKAPIGIFETTASGEVVSINKTMASILGYPSKEGALKCYKNLNKDLYINPTDREELIMKLNSKNSIKNFEFKALGKNKKPIWISLNVKKVTLNKPNDFLLQGFAFDISKRKANDEKLENQKKEIIKAYEQVTSYNEEILAINEELEYSLDQLNALNNRYMNMIELVSKTKDKNILNEDDFFNNLLKQAIEIIPEADYGKIGIINNQNQFEFIDAVGHNMDILKGLTFNKNILLNNKGSQINCTTDYFFDKNQISFEKRELLQALKPIKESLYINILVEEEMVGRIGFDIKKGSNRKFTDITRKVLQAFATLASSFFAFKRFDELQNNFTKEILTSIIKIMEMYDLYTKGHSESVAAIASAIAKEMGLSKKQLQNTYWSGLVHDIGKLLIPLSILNKNDKLTETEYELVKKHPVWGNKALSHSKILKPIAKYILHHHEKWDGTGYPEGLKGNEIPLISQIIAVADAWDAMLSKRAYRDSLSIDQALTELKKNKGSQFSPEVAEVLIRIIQNDKIKKLSDEVFKNDLKTTEKEDPLLKEELNHQILFEEFNDGIVILDEDFNIIRVNEYFTNMFGFEEKKLLGKSITKIVPKEKLNETHNIMNELKHNEKIYAKTTRRRSNGEMIKVSIHGFSVSLNNNHMGYYLIYRDITELEEAKMQYKLVENRYQVLFDNEDIPMLIIDPESGQIIDANIAAEKFYGWNKKELKVKNITEINTLSKKQMKNEMKNAKYKKRKYFMFNHRTALGEIKKVQVYSHPIKFGEKNYLYSIIHDSSRD